MHIPCRARQKYMAQQKQTELTELPLVGGGGRAATPAALSTLPQQSLFPVGQRPPPTPHPPFPPRSQTENSRFQPFTLITPQEE